MSVQVKGSGTIGGLDEGLVVSGIVTSSTQINVGSNIKVGSAGVITATTFHGSGANLTGIDSTQIVTGNTSVQTVDTGSDGHVKVITEGSERLRINSTGNMGLGVSDPNVLNEAAKFQELTLGGKTEGAAITLKDDNGNVQGGLFTSDNTGAMIVRTITNHPLMFRTNNTERVRITSGGAVMINTTNSSSRTLNLKGTFGILSASQTGVLDMSVTDGGEASIGPYVAGGSSLIFKTNSSGAGVAERLRISSAGYVTKPNHPAFIAGRTGGNHTATIGTFPLNVTRLNVGNHYSTSTYKFTAPVAGVYYFHAQVYYNNGSGAYRVGFRKEPSGGSAIMLNTAAHAMVGNDNTQSLSIIESLAVGDTVRLFSDQNASIQCYYNINDNTYGAHTYFMGYLIG